MDRVLGIYIFSCIYWRYNDFKDLVKYYYNEIYGRINFNNFKCREGDFCKECRKFIQMFYKEIKNIEFVDSIDQVKS